MSILENAAEPFVQSADAGAIQQLHDAFAAQRRAFATARNPSLAARRDRLGALIAMMATNRARIAEAVRADFGAHPQGASDLIEVAGVIGRAAYVAEHLGAWMQPSPRDVDTAVYGSASAHVAYQPKGVVGNMVPWNFPFDLSVGPMVDMLAAGNRVIVKPSEYAPASAALLAEMIAATFDADLVTVVVGGVDLARAFAATPWDHLLYTGSPDVGRQVMAAAAANLTPVTLELGGKCPAILLPGAVTPANVESVVGTKMVKNGQMCVSVDYALVPREDVEAFVAHAGAFMDRAAPGYAKGAECTGIISDRHLGRLEAMLDEATARQTRIVTLEDDPAIDRTTRRMPLSLLIDPAPDTRVMREEIFGPLLPVISYDDVDEAIAFVNGGERPLGLYLFGDDAVLTTRVLDETHSGGVAINTCAVQSALPSMGFGGSGASGMGRHHGIEGFREFSNPRGVVVRGDRDLIDAFYAPYAKAVAVVDAALGPAR
uniref:aldehyde dehydrogenase family protein n=1 Tax=uncultured Sphingomonas sp. TaxID=158754 RepID=UPI0035CB29AC